MAQSIFTPFQPIAAIATTPAAAQKLISFCQSAGATLWVSQACRELLPSNFAVEVQVYQTSLPDLVATLWPTYRALVFSLATGAVVRLIAPLLENKLTDPAVVVVDAAGQFAISLCSGHQGGADQLTRLVAQHLGATAVFSSGSTSLQLPEIDILGLPFGWQRGTGDWTGVSAAVVRGEPVEVIQEAGSRLWRQHLPAIHPLKFDFPEFDPGNLESSPTATARIWISPTLRQFSPQSSMPKVQWHPRVLWVGIGCERGTSRRLIERAIEETCQVNHLAVAAIAGIATIDLKGDEVGLVELCRDRHWPLRTFAAEQLKAMTVPTPSAVVEQEVGTPSVAEAAALCAAEKSSQILSEQELSSSLGNALLVSKQICRREGEPGAVTIAIAQSHLEFTARNGQLWLIGTGPGNLDQISPAAQAAISQADAIIGYSLYIDLIAPLLRPGQIVEALPITQERQRAQRAIALANWGLTVAVISSGDCGIYGMAGLVFEELRAQNWDGQTPGVQVFPGITALQAAASRVGAPLMHDFCAISLSDLLTPWEMIEKRLNAAAMADFVIALYNPRSRTRTEQLAIAQQIFLQHRPSTTPVAIVRSAYRQDEEITLTTLDKMLTIPIDMLTILLIGNSSTRTYGNWMITPRGYLGFGE